MWMKLSFLSTGSGFLDHLNVQQECDYKYLMLAKFKHLLISNPGIGRESTAALMAALFVLCGWLRSKDFLVLLGNISGYQG